MRILSLVVILLVVIFGLSFAALNSTQVTVNYYVGQRALPLSLVVIISFVLGGVLGLLASAWMTLRAKFQAYRLKKRLKVAEKEIENLRAIPIQNKH